MSSSKEHIFEKELKLRTVLDCSNASITVIDKNLRIIAYNKAAEKTALELGFPPPAIHTSILENLNHRGSKAFLRNIAKALQGQTVQLEWNPYQHVDNKEDYWFHLSYTPIADEQGRVYAVCQTAVDINHQKKVEKELKESMDLLELALRGTDDGIWDYNLVENSVYYSPRWKQIMGYQNHELSNLPATWQKLLLEEDMHETIRAFNDYVEGRTFRYEITQRYRHKNGSLVYVLSRAILIRGNKGEPQRLVGTISDITRLKLAEERIRKSEEMMAEAQKIAKMGSWSWNLLTNKITWSAQMYKNLGLEPEEITPTPESFLEFVHPADRKKVLDVVLASMRQKHPQVVECRGIQKNGQEVFFYCEGYVESNEAGKPHRVIGIIIDITERKKVEQELIRAKEIAEESSRAKEKFLSTMSHEIRTPMNAVVGLTHLLLQEDPKDYQVENLKVLQFASNNLLMLINDILDFSKIEAGKVVFEQVNFQLYELINNVKNTHRFSAKDKSLELKVNIEPNTPRYLLGDPVRLSQILNNLISNAVKFTNKGSISIRVSVNKASRNDVELLFAVKDSGIGIAEDKLDAIFDSFTQASSDITRRYGGTGLGLAISKNLVELQGGQIWVQSTPGKGSTFSFYLPYKKGNATEKTQTLEEAEEEKRGNLSGIRILVVEDNEGNQFVISRFLRLWQAEVVIVNNGFEALERIRSRDFDLVLMDLQMPGMDGYTATEKIRDIKDEYFSQLPIIALTASVILDVEQKIRKAGMNDYVIKPFNPQLLYKKIVQYTSKKNSALNTQPFSQKQINYQMHLGFEKFNKTTLGDREFAMQLLEVYIRQFAEYIDELQEAAQSYDLNKIKFINHKIKSTILVLEAQAVADAQGRLNTLANKEAEKEQIQAQSELIVGLCREVNGILRQRLTMLSS